ncbi:hypothetical protein [Methylocystis iwaonis]|uniref:hypothetical protein n=1 Tax=Methylocystis iwaonis TaxID=2885079 RepID=UPI0033135B35
MDLGLPGMNGYELAREIRKLPNGPNLVLIALSDWGQEEVRRRALKAGFNLGARQRPQRAAARLPRHRALRAKRIRNNLLLKCLKVGQRRASRRLRGLSLPLPKKIPDSKLVECHRASGSFPLVCIRLRSSHEQYDREVQGRGQ